jgi:hypothetical protein
MASEKAGGKIWIVPDCFLPAQSTGDLKSHESTCVLNIGKKPATLKLTAYFENREPMEGFQATCQPRRTNHVRLDSLKNRRGDGIPVGTPFALKIESSVKVVVQHTRLDTTQPALALMTTMAYAAA